MPTIATAGHVDHGKSSLVRALTGTDPDRLAEEKRRGMTIDLGFAHTTTTDGTVVSFVDVPGHSDFVRTMIAGASGVDVVLLVIDAREGWKPQTYEHLGICELLGARTGVVAITKIDLVDEARTEEVVGITRAELESSSMNWTDIVPTSVSANRGLDLLTTSLARAVKGSAGDGSDLDRPRLFVDRVFTIVGSGTVVTGTLDSGTLRPGDELESVPGGHRALVKSLQMHGQPAQAGRPGTRCAINLARTSTMDIARGDALVVQGQWHHTTVVDVSYRPARGAQLPLAHGHGWTMHVGTARRSVSVRLLPLADSSARLRFSPPLPLTPGDNIVLRHTGTDSTVAGGTILDVDPVSRTTRARPDGSVTSILDGRGWIDTAHARRLTGRDVAAVADHWVAVPDTVADTTAHLDALLDSGSVDVVSLSEPERALLSTLAGVIVERGSARRGDRNPLFDHPSVGIIRDAGVTPPPCTDFDRDVIRRLLQSGILVEHDGIAFHTDTLVALVPVLDALWRVHPGGFTVSQLREELGITRKHAVPLAVCLDKLGLTKRSGDLRVSRTHTVRGTTS